MKTYIFIGSRRPRTKVSQNPALRSLCYVCNILCYYVTSTVMSQTSGFHQQRSRGSRRPAAYTSHSTGSVPEILHRRVNQSLGAHNVIKRFSGRFERPASVTGHFTATAATTIATKNRRWRQHQRLRQGRAPYYLEGNHNPSKGRPKNVCPLFVPM